MMAKHSARRLPAFHPAMPKLPAFPMAPQPQAYTPTAPSPAPPSASPPSPSAGASSALAQLNQIAGGS